SARVWDARNGAAITPPLLHALSLNCGTFSPDGKYIATGGEDGLLRLWRWECLNRPVRDLIELAELLPGYVVDRTGRYEWLDPHLWEARWKTHRASSPADHSTALQDIQTWHEAQAQAAEQAAPDIERRAAMAGTHAVEMWEFEDPVARGRALRFHLDRLIA